ncbi:glycoside hydrolase family 12 protein [Dothidotthia symphoricarpi CBS 119687]|uniref:Glycoside hydrolase family 12 protein n=1 Tax=Dothidotthia symphoricarpi CBS 119687 TaxID=1392245 RepID=A0A6A6ASN8_9PLEO|nr:glycoside hydrolase family 12 protein [Dothidotthia symphoricarpi CBS 119687]KAF2134969.1 glycoside hydrolase family 12 protein [Dothidotthia symphoricarpi CBS 119687]
MQSMRWLWHILEFALFTCTTLAFQELCNRSENIQQGDYRFNNNAWGEDDSGSVCTYVPNNNSNYFYSEWEWSTQPARVRAYPHIQFESDLLPLTFANISSLNFTLKWAMSPVSLIASASDDPTTHPNDDALEAINVEANVVADLFADADMVVSQQSANQTYEIMVWFGRFGSASKPIGMDDRGQMAITASVGGFNFTLYNGTNGNGQSVFSWVSPSILTSFSGDMSPFLHQLARYGLIPWDTYLGVVQFGTETFYSNSKVKFACKNFQAALGGPYAAKREPPPTITVESLPTKASAAMNLVAFRGDSMLRLSYAALLVHIWAFADLRCLGSL